jgi:hypothetical protein
MEIIKVFKDKKSVKYDQLSEETKKAVTKLTDITN